MEQGTLFVKLESAREALPVQGRVVISQTVNGVRVLEIELVTDEDGLTQPVTLDAPDRSISLDPASTQQAWAAYDVEAYADGYSDILLEGVQVYSGVEAYAPISMLPIFSSQAVSPTAVTADTGSTSRKAQQDILHTTIPAPAIRGGSASGPAPLSTCATQPLVLQSVFIPQYITVHLGAPSAAAENVTVSFPEYVKNVASSEIYPTWEPAAIRANILAIISFALNRVYTEYYPSRGYPFNITASTAYDQKFIKGRNIFENISQMVDEIFNSYIRRTGFVEPLAAKFCNGTTTTCDGLSQWGSQAMAEQGADSVTILRNYYGDNIEIVNNAPVMGIRSSYPGTPVRLGDRGEPVVRIQTMLNRISRDYPAIPKVQPVDGIFGASTEQSVIKFQQIFSLTPDGVVGNATWYKLVFLYVGVLELAELVSEGQTFYTTLVPVNRPDTISLGDTGENVKVIQYLLSVVAEFYNNIPPVAVDGIFGQSTQNAVLALQQMAGLYQDGVVGEDTWAALYRFYVGIVDTMSQYTNVIPEQFRPELPESEATSLTQYPGQPMTLGSTDERGEDAT